eukprot:SAG31_NODE_797_length_12029_cov_13.875692_4_plen_201_part_00
MAMPAWPWRHGHILNMHGRTAVGMAVGTSYERGTCTAVAPPGGDYSCTREGAAAAAAAHRGAHMLAAPQTDLEIQPQAAGVVAAAQSTQAHIRGDLEAAETLAKELKLSVRRLLQAKGGSAAASGDTRAAQEVGDDELTLAAGQQSYDGGVSSIMDYHERQVAYLSDEHTMQELEWESRFCEQDNILALQRDVASEVRSV